MCTCQEADLKYTGTLSSPQINIMKWMQLWISVRQNRKLSTVVLLLRYLLGFAFIPSGMKKILGERFTSIGLNDPIGFFFEGLYRSGYYWNFLGWGQLLAAFLLMTQRFSTIGNLIFFFIVTNITDSKSKNFLK